eukprot:g61921.t1
MRLWHSLEAEAHLHDISLSRSPPSMSYDWDNIDHFKNNNREPPDYKELADQYVFSPVRAAAAGIAFVILGALAWTNQHIIDGLKFTENQLTKVQAMITPKETQYISYTVPNRPQGAPPMVALYQAQSLDGYIAKSDGSLDWLDRFSKANTDFGYQGFLDTVDALIMGSNTYSKIMSFGRWPYPGNTHTHTYIHTYIHTIQTKIQTHMHIHLTVSLAIPANRMTVVMTTHPKIYLSERENRDVVIFSDLPPREILRKLGESGYKKVWLVGGAKIAYAFLRENLIDEATVAIMPVLLGAGLNFLQAPDNEVSEVSIPTDVDQLSDLSVPTGYGTTARLERWLTLSEVKKDIPTGVVIVHYTKISDQPPLMFFGVLNAELPAGPAGLFSDTSLSYGPRSDLPFGPHDVMLILLTGNKSLILMVGLRGRFSQHVKAFQLRLEAYAGKSTA